MTRDSSPDSQSGPSGEDTEISVLDIALVLAENLAILVVVPLATGLLALGIGFLLTPTFTATARILPPVQQQSLAAAFASQLGALAGLASGVAGIKSPTDQYIALLRSGPVLDAMIARFKLKELWKLRYTADARKALIGQTKIAAGVKDGIISIDVDDEDPKRAAEMANAYIEELRNFMKTLAITEPAQRRLFFEAQLKQTKDDLLKAELGLRGSGISEAALKTIPQSALETLSRISAQITAQEIKLAAMRMSMTESNPDFQSALQQLVAMRIELAKAERSNVAKAGGEGAEYIAKYRDFKYYETLFELMARQYELARLEEGREGAVIQVVEAAQPPERKSKPKKALIAVVATLVMFAVVIVFVFARHMLRNMAKEASSAEKLVRLRRLLSMRRA